MVVGCFTGVSVIEATSRRQALLRVCSHVYYILLSTYLLDISPSLRLELLRPDEVQLIPLRL